MFKGKEEVTVPRTQHTPVDAGQFKEMVKGVVSRLPTEFVDGAYPTTEPAWYHERVAELLKLPHNSEEARQLERILTSGPLTAETLNNPYVQELIRRALFLPSGFVPAEPEEFLARVLAWMEQRQIPGIADFDPSRVSENAKKWPNYEQSHGFCVCPKPSLLGPRLGVEDPLTYLGLLTEAGPMAAIASQRKIKNWREGKMGSDHYELVASGKDAILELEEMQPGGFIVFPISTGDGFGEWNPSPRNALCEVEVAKNPRKWPMPSYGGLWYVFGNPSRISAYEHLCMDFIGDRIRLEPSEPFDLCTRLHFLDDQLYFGFRSLRSPNEFFGPVFGFLP